MLDGGDVAPDFTLPIDGGGEITLSSMRGKKVVLYFYPKDDTSGCTKEACDFREKISEFTKAGAVVLGLSPDSVKKHDKFKAKYDLPFSLVADEEKTALEAFGVWVEKSMYGRKYMGVERSTFLIDVDGSIQSVWRKVKVPGHVDAVLDAVQT
jgi:peroxiredoxin Q/BCP